MEKRIVEVPASAKFHIELYYVRPTKKSVLAEREVPGFELESIKNVGGMWHVKWRRTRLP